MQTLRIDVWSDIACPWCHVGKRRLEAALESFPHREAVEVVWHAFELDPAAPRSSESAPYAASLARKYGASLTEAELMIRRMTATAAGRTPRRPGVLVSRHGQVETQALSPLRA